MIFLKALKMPNLPGQQSVTPVETVVARKPGEKVGIYVCMCYGLDMIHDTMCSQLCVLLYFKYILI